MKVENNHLILQRSWKYNQSLQFKLPGLLGTHSLIHKQILHHSDWKNSTIYNFFLQFKSLKCKLFFHGKIIWHSEHQSTCGRKNSEIWNSYLQGKSLRKASFTVLVLRSQLCNSLFKSLQALPLHTHCSELATHVLTDWLACGGGAQRLQHCRCEGERPLLMGHQLRLSWSCRGHHNILQFSTLSLRPIYRPKCWKYTESHSSSAAGVLQCLNTFILVNILQ